MEYCWEVQYFVERSIRRGVATFEELREISGRYGGQVADTVAEELGAAGVRLASDHDIPVTPQSNVLMNGIRLLDLVSIAIQLPVAGRVPRHLHREVIRRRSFELDLRRLDYLDGDHEWFYLSPAFNELQRATRRLFDSGRVPFAKEWRCSTGDEPFLNGLIGHPLFRMQVMPLIRTHYLQLKPVRSLVGWIRATRKRAPAMVDIVSTGLVRDGAKAVSEVLLSQQASTADEALRKRRDVCFHCPPERRCAALQALDDPYNALVEYRYSDLETLVARRHPGETRETYLSKDWLLSKFFIPYSITTVAKRWMIAIGMLDDECVVLDKSHGRYCPREDSWALASNALALPGGEACQR